MASSCINHQLKDVTNELNWPVLKQSLRLALNKRVADIINNFSEAVSHRVTADGHKFTDPSMYDGSGGVAFALYKYSLLVNEEAEFNQSRHEIRDMTNQYADEAIKLNLKIVEEMADYENKEDNGEKEQHD
jgi:hypothetical protein